MKITKVESLHADGGWRSLDFLKIGTDEGLVGWSEYNESFGGVGVSAAIAGLAPLLVGKDPRPWEAHVALLSAVRRQAAGGVIQQAIGAIENALLDIKARALGIPVYELFGGPVRDRIRLYWSHCGTYRVSRAKEMGIPPVRTLDDIVAMGREVVAKGYTALKTNALLLGDNPRAHVPGFARGAGFPELNADRYVLDGDRGPARGVPRGRGARHGHPGGPELQLQDRGLLEGGAGDGAVRPVLGRDGHPRRGGAAPTSAAAPRSRSPRASACTAGATTGRSSSSRRWTWRSSTRRGTASWSR